jgi:DNA-binding MarR family transcriptional regulator
MPARPRTAAPAPSADDAAAAGTPLQRHLSYRLHQIHKLSDAATAAAYRQHCSLPIGEARCLAAIGSIEPLSVNDLAQGANLDKAQASRAAQALVARGLVRKDASAHDGRGVVLQLTPAGRALHQQVMALVAQRNDEIFGCLSAADQQRLGMMLDRLIAHAQSRAAAPRAPAAAPRGVRRDRRALPGA